MYKRCYGKKSLSTLQLDYIYSNYLIPLSNELFKIEYKEKYRETIAIFNFRKIKLEYTDHGSQKFSL